MGNLTKFLYDVVIINKDNPQGIRIDWGNHPGWIDEYANELDAATVLWLVPKDKGSSLRNVSVKLGGGKKWILFSRVYGSTSGGLDKQVRIYAIGWHETINGVNRKSMVWVYPSGEMEISEEPSYAGVFIDMMMRGQDA